MACFILQPPAPLLPHRGAMAGAEAGAPAPAPIKAGKAKAKLVVSAVKVRLLDGLKECGRDGETWRDGDSFTVLHARKVRHLVDRIEGKTRAKVVHLGQWQEGELLGITLSRKHEEEGDAELNAYCALGINPSVIAKKELATKSHERIINKNPQRAVP